MNARDTLASTQLIANHLRHDCHGWQLDRVVPMQTKMVKPEAIFHRYRRREAIVTLSDSWKTFLPYDRLHPSATDSDLVGLHVDFSSVPLTSPHQTIGKNLGCLCGDGLSQNK